MPRSVHSGRRSSRRIERGALEHYNDPAYYTRAYRKRRQDIEYYVRRAKHSRGPVLEYGIGNGRIAIALARAGIEVVGIDLSQPMLDDLASRVARLPKQRRTITWFHGDMRTLQLGRQFPLVIAPFNTLLHLYERADVEHFLAAARSHLAPNARLVFDVSVPHPPDLEDDDTWRGGPRVRHPASSELVRYRERFQYDAIRQVLCVDMEFARVEDPEFADESWVVPLSHRQFFPLELEALLHYNGFTDIRLTADFTDLAPDSSVDSLVVDCRAAPVARPPLRP